MATAALFCLAFADATASVLWRSNADAALAVWANDSRALTQKAEGLLQSMQAPNIAEAAKLSRRSLATAPLQVRALRVLGTTSELNRESRGSSTQLQLAGRLSRRDLKTQLWEIEYAVQRNDIAQVLRYYDIALRTKPDSQQLLFPLLASGLEDPAIRMQFVPYLRSGSPWVLSFLVYAAERGQAPGALASLLAAEKPGVANWIDEISPKLLNRLLMTGDVAHAELYGRSLPAYTNGLEHDSTLRPSTMAATLRPLTWTPQEQTGAFGRADLRRGSIHIYADAQVTGEVLHRFMSLPPGRYAFSTSQSIASAGPGATARWKIKCLRAGHFVEQWTSRDPVITGRSRTAEELVLPSNCRHQYITLTVNGGIEAVPLEYDLTSIAIRRLS